METRRTVRISINGLVQGVAFRAWLRATAQELGVTGWVRNRRDGTVEAVLQGPPQEVTDVLRRCERGPPAACVESVASVAIEDDVYESFEVRPSA